MSDFSQMDYFTDPSLIADPYPYFRYLRAAGPVRRLPAQNAVAVAAFDQGLAVYLDTAHFSAVNAVTGPFPPPPFAIEGNDITPQIAAHRSRMPFGMDLLTLDPPRHTQLRSLCMLLFTPKRLRELEGYIARLADQLIDELLGNEEVEFVSGYAKPFATLVIADLIGVPEEDRALFRALAGTQASRVGERDDEPIRNPIEARVEKFTAYARDRRENPRNDILSELANGAFADGSIPDLGDVVRLAALLFGAGQDTTATLLGTCLRILAQDQKMQARLRGEPHLIPDFIEEVLRFDGPVKAINRLVARSTVLGGVELPAGTNVSVINAALNRDPSRYDSPDEFRLGRPHAREHLAFGRGAHTCPGASLARAEARISLERILARIGSIELDERRHGRAGAHHFEYVPNYVFRTLSGLHLKLKPAR